MVWQSCKSNLNIFFDLFQVFLYLMKAGYIIELSRRFHMFLGIGLVLVGVFVILDKLYIIHGDVWDFIIPIILIALGAEMIFSRKKHLKKEE